MINAQIKRGGVVVKHADSRHRGCQFDSSMCHFQNSIGEESNGKTPREFHFPRKKLRAPSLVSATLEIKYATQLLGGLCRFGRSSLGDGQT